MKITSLEDFISPVQGLQKQRTKTTTTKSNTKRLHKYLKVTQDEKRRTDILRLRNIYFSKMERNHYITTIGWNLQTAFQSPLNLRRKTNRITYYLRWYQEIP
eukprot:13953066-Ditylum_brightwellii.AAC.1